jgi:hypothetical protein
VLGQEGEEAETGAIAQREPVLAGLTQLFPGEGRQDGSQMPADRPPGGPQVVQRWPLPDVVDAPRIRQQRGEGDEEGPVEAPSQEWRVSGAVSPPPTALRGS